MGVNKSSLNWYTSWRHIIVYQLLQYDGSTWNYIVMLATLVEGDLKAPFSIASTPRCRGGCNSIPQLLHFTLDTYLIMLSVKQSGIKYHFLVLNMTRPEIEPRSPGPLANTLLIWIIAWFVLCIYTNIILLFANKCVLLKRHSYLKLYDV